MKKILSFIAVLSALSLLCIVTYAEGEFEIIDGELIKYSGTEEILTIPDDVNNISAGAFEEVQGITCVIINSLSCTFEEGAIPDGVLVKAHESSEAHSAALRDGLDFVTLDIPDNTVMITINYQFISGEEAHPMFTEELNIGDSYSYTVPDIEGFSPNISVIEGVTGESDITVTVIYRSNLGDGWVIKDGRAMYVSDGSYLVDTTHEIDGLAYSFDENGYLMIGAGFLVTPNGSYYFHNNVAVTGYRIIGKSIYCFNEDGTMIQGTTHDGLEFDISGALMGSDIIVSVGEDKYFLIANELYSGYRLINGTIRYFGSDYKMAVNTELDGLTFDSSGAIISGISAGDLEVSGLTDVAYTGSPQEPMVSVKFKGITLTRNVHYKLNYINNTAPGEATLEIEGLGPVNGKVSYSFKIIGNEAYTLTIRYINVMGAPIAESYTTLIEPGEQFDVPSPHVEGYKPNQESVSGTMGTSNITISVTYTKVAETSDTNEPDDTTSPLESTESTSDSTVPEESTSSEGKDSESKGYTYDYALLIKVFIIATVITGGSIVMILNWETIKKSLTKKKSKK